MKLILLIIAAILVSCNQNQVPTTEVPQAPEVKSQPIKIPTVPTQTPNPGHIGEGSMYAGPTKPFPSATGYFTVKINTENCSDDQNKKYKLTEDFITKYVNSQNFKDLVMGFEFKKVKAFNNNEGMTNSEIYAHLVKGAEALMPSENYQMDITAVCYLQKFTSTIGYTYPNTLKIYANMKFHSSYTACDVAGNTFHEWTHKMGFDHSATYSADRDFSVPYGLGYAVVKACKEVGSGALKLRQIGELL